MADFKLYQWVFFAIGPGNCFLCFNGRTRNKGIIAGNILKNDHSIVLGMNLFLHNHAQFRAANVQLFSFSANLILNFLRAF
jgi:hypothetical protein